MEGTILIHFEGVRLLSSWGVCGGGGWLRFVR